MGEQHSEAGADELSASQAFAMLGDETRIAILSTLWDAHEPYTDTALTFSELRDRLGRIDSGKFNYHLNKLVGHFVFQSEEEYRLTENGVRVAQAILGGTPTERLSDSRIMVDAPCFLCGGPTEIRYQNRFFHHVCVECDGRVGPRYGVPRGTLQRGWIRPPGESGRSSAELFASHMIRKTGRQLMIVNGICPECSGSMDTELLVCDDHDRSAGICENCGVRERINGQWTCTVCKFAWRLPATERVRTEPTVASFHTDRGIAYDPSSYEDYVRFTEWDQEIVHEDPTELRVTVRALGDELELSLDEALQIIAGG